MFDLIGVWSSSREINLDANALPTAMQGQNHLPFQIVEANNLRAYFLTRPSEKPCYHATDSFNLFIVGEPRLRSDASVPLVHLQAKQCPLLSAADVFALYQSAPEGFFRWIKGNFTVVLLDALADRATLYNSRFGISPFYYAKDQDRFLFSTSSTAIAKNLSHRSEYDLAAIGELALFNYPLGDRTFFHQVKMLRPSEIVCAGPDGLQNRMWWDVRTLYESTLYSESAGLEVGSELFHKTVNDLASDQERVRLSFTSGFDSRANLAVLDMAPSEVLAYSFGIPGSLNVEIPKEICGRLAVAFCPIYLDEKYERVFDTNATRAVLLSDGLATVERANYPYAFERLADFSPVVITGLFGSELLRTFQNVGSIVSANLAQLNLAADPLAQFRNLLTAPNLTKYFDPQLITAISEQIQEDISNTLVAKFQEMSADRRFYMFLLTEGLRKYFGAETQMERPWGINRFPFLDDEFVEFAFRAPFAGVYSRTLKPTIENRYRSQYFYAFVIRKYRPELLNETTDHGYPPADVLSPLALCKIVPQVLFFRWELKRTGYREFKTEEWTETFYKRHLFHAPANDLFSLQLKDDLATGQWKTQRLEFAKAASLKLWLESLENTQ